MSEIKKLLIADHGGAEIRIKRMGLLGEMNTKMNLIGDYEKSKIIGLRSIRTIV